MKFHYFFDNEKSFGWSNYYMHQELNQTYMYKDWVEMKERKHHVAREYCLKRNDLIYVLNSYPNMLTLVIPVENRKVEVWHSCFCARVKGVNKYNIFGINGAHASASFKLIDMTKLIYPLQYHCNESNYSQFPNLPQGQDYQGNITLENIVTTSDGPQTKVYAVNTPTFFIIDPMECFKYFHFMNNTPEDLFQKLMSSKNNKLEDEHDIDFANFLWCVSKGLVPAMKPSTDFKFHLLEKETFQYMDLLQAKVFKHILDEDNWF